jgi:hypothetical protein
VTRGPEIPSTDERICTCSSGPTGFTQSDTGIGPTGGIPRSRCSDGASDATVVADVGTQIPQPDREETLRLMTLRPYIHSRGEKVAMHWVDADGFSNCGLHAEEWFIPTEAQRACKVCEPDA